ncbi:MAG: O-antigen ligase family protein [Actinomycetota bacterium]|nr:O-antigen ligase family protein [Actinomycetota bacterium]
MIPALYALIGAAGLAGLLTRAGRRERVASLLLVAAGTLALLGWLGVAHTLRAHAVPAAVALVVALAAGIAAARGLQRWPLALPFAACLAAPFRFPVHIGSQDANLLVPLYAVIGVAWLALALETLRGAVAVRLPPRRLALPLLVFVAWEAASLAWSDSASEGAKAMAFYALPFGVLLAALVAHPPPLPKLPDLLRVQVALALAFAAVGVYQVLRHDVWWNRKLMVSNAFSSFFRANSIFYDPSIFGRYQAVTITLVFAALLFGTVRRPLAAGIAAGLAWVGILTSYSQSALLALCSAVAAGLALTFGRRLAWLLLLGALAVGVGLLAVPSVRHAGLDRVTSKRSDLVGDGLRLFKAHPLAGVGLGGSTRAAREQTDRGRAVRHAQHVMPLTVASELGLVGLALVAWLLTVLARLALMRPFRPERLALGLGLLAIFVHSLFYAAFFEDPLTWGLAALLAACAAPGMIEGR